MDEELTSLLHRKRELDRHLAGLESQIYNLEDRYLEETSVDGNVVVGFAGYMSVAQGTSAPTQADGVFGSSAVTETDRIFSNSSSTYRKVLCEIKHVSYNRVCRVCSI
jgi:chromatin modification-related protein EAF6